MINKDQDWSVAGCSDDAMMNDERVGVSTANSENKIVRCRLFCGPSKEQSACVSVVSVCICNYKPVYVMYFADVQSELSRNAS